MTTNYNIPATKHTALSEESSATLSALRFPMILAVVCIHASSLTIPSGDGISALPAIIAFFISNILALVAVPFFFSIAGFLFFLDGNCSWAAIRKKWSNRARSLGIPYLFWCTLGACILIIGQSIPIIAGMIRASGPPFHESSPWNIIARTFGLRGDMPIAYQFWFIRDLILMILLAPALCRLGWNMIGSLAIIMGMAWWLIAPEQRLLVDPKSFLWFTIGAVISIRPQVLDHLATMRHWGYLFAALATTIAITMLTPWGKQAPWIGSVFIITAIPPIWILLYNTPGKKHLIPWGSASFFVFACHEPLLTLVRKILLALIHPISSWSYFLIYGSSIVITVVAAWSVYTTGKKIMPRAISVIIGGR